MPFDPGVIGCEAAIGSCIAIGNFDGVHRGHQAMIAALRRQADAMRVAAVAMTFDPAPVELLRPEIAPPRLMRLQDRITYLKEAGADAVCVVPTTIELLDLSAEDFFTLVLQKRFQVRGLVEGPNFRFGRDRQGDTAFLGVLCQKAGISLSIVETVTIDGVMISSTAVRQAVQSGNVALAARLLGRPHQVAGTVVRGAGRGTDFGFPTANLSNVATLLPPDGVYAGRTTIDNVSYPVAMHIGPNRTFGESNRQVEAHVLEFSGDLYGRTLSIEIVERIRESAKFESPEALVAQLRKDCDRVRSALATCSAHR